MNFQESKSQNAETLKNLKYLLLEIKKQNVLALVCSADLRTWKLITVKSCQNPWRMILEKLIFRKVAGFYHKVLSRFGAVEHLTLAFFEQLYSNILLLKTNFLYHTWH